MEDRRLDEDADGFEEHFNKADDDAFPHVQQYYASLTPDILRGDEFFDTRLVNFHEGPNLLEERYFSSRPKSRSYLCDDPRKTPTDHPLRAIACPRGCSTRICSAHFLLLLNRSDSDRLARSCRRVARCQSYPSSK